MHSSSQGFQPKIATAALVMMLVAIWLLLRGYHGLVGDGHIYAFQALARIHPYLANDLYLENTSQDQFTIFSPLYAWFIGFLGLEPAARSLTLLFTVSFLGAAWIAAQSLTDWDGAWLAVALLLIVDGSFGGSGVFRFAEPFLTARLPAEALIVTSLACYYRGLKLLAVVIATAALFVHPLIALPGLLLLLCLSIPISVSVVGAIVCVIVTMLVSGAVTWPSWMSNLLPVMDSAWLAVVQERSQFLFLQLWSFQDWALNARPFFYLAFIALAAQDIRVRRLCIAAAVVGAAGLAVALIASLLGPVAILVQGQAWRWVWIAAFVSILLVPATILQISRDKRRGPLCAILLISGLTLPALGGTACVSLAMIFWLMGSHIAARAQTLFHGIFFALVVGIAAWLVVHSGEIVASAIHTSGATGAAQLRDIFGLKISAALAAAFVWWWMRKSRSVWVPTLLCAVLLVLSIFILPAAFKQSRTFASATDAAEFSDWERTIPPTSAVLVTPARDVGTFVWFTLQRPNYLAVDQSAGVVFSRKTALEVQRRSQVLLPVTDPSWTILTNLRAAPDKRSIDVPTRPLTATTLSGICEDSQLGFVISPQDVGFDRLRHQNAGSWKDWNLYDCHKVRSMVSAK
jgi:hypothetical protein